jgi:hypothetical protein
MRGLALIYQLDSIVDSATATAELMEQSVINEIKLQDIIEVEK